MSGQGPARAGDIFLGPFPVAAEPDTIAAFAAACGAPGAEPSAVFPALWLSTPELKAALRAALARDLLPGHESQSFYYERPLRSGGRYVLTGVARRETNPDRLLVVAQAAEADGSVVVEMRSVLRLFTATGDF